MTSEKSAQSSPPPTFPTPASFSVFPHERELNLSAFSFSSSTSLYHLFKMYRRDQVNSLEFCITMPSSFEKRLSLIYDEGRDWIFHLKLETMIFMFSPKEQILKKFPITTLKKNLKPRAETCVYLKHLFEHQSY